MTGKFFIVARWEFIEKVKTKSFILSLIITPLILFLFSMVPSLLAERESESTKVIGVIDSSGVFFKDMKTSLESFYLDNVQPAYILLNLSSKENPVNNEIKISDSLVINSKVEGVIVIIQNSQPYLLQYRSLNTGNIRDIKRFEKAFNEIKIKNTLSAAGIDQNIMKDISAETEIKEIRLDKYGNEAETGFVEIFFSSLFLIMILAFVILSSGGMLIRSLVEEKSNRLIEILVSSCSAEELLTGKILGLSLLALFQMVIWILIAFALRGSNLLPTASFDNIVPMLIYFLLGFIFYISVFVGIGSVVSTEQEAQQVTGYLSMILMLPIVFSISTIQDPDSGLVKILTYFPLTTPTIMLLKFNIKPVGFTEIMVTSAIMLISITAVIFISSKIFRIGILSYGKIPSLKQMFHWIRE